MAVRACVGCAGGCLPLCCACRCWRAAAPGAAAQSVSHCGSPTTVPARTPPVNIADVIVFDFTSNSFGIWTNEAGEATVTVTRTGARAASVDYETGDGTLTAPGDYTHTAGTLRFAEGETSKSFTVPVSGAPGFFRVFLSNASDGGGVCPGSARPWGSTVRVHPVRPAGLILSPAGSLTVTEGGSASYTVRLNSRPAGGDVTVTVGGASGTDVTVDTDGGMAGDQDTLTFTTSNWHRPRTVTLRAREDTDGAWDRVTLTHTASGADYGSVAGALVVTVSDNDGNTPLIEFTQNAIDTGEGLMAVVRVRKLGSGAATVDYATADGTATAPADYTAASGTLSFASGETEKTVTVAIVNNVTPEGRAAEMDENFTITLSNPSGTVLGPNRVATVRIKQPRFEFTSENYYVQENQGPAVITVRKIGPGAGEVEYLTRARGDPLATTPDDRALVEGTLTFAAGDTVKSFTVPIVDDGVVEPDEIFGVALRTRPLLGQLGENLARVTIRNHPPAPIFKFKSWPHSVREDEGAATITITKTHAGAATVDYETREFLNSESPGAATPSADYTPVSGTLSFASEETEKTVTVPIVNDDVDEPNELILFVLWNPSGGILDPQALANLDITPITVNDDDPLVIGFASGTLAVHEGDGTATLTVTKTGATVRVVTVRYATADATAVASGDYTNTSGILTFGPSETEKTIDIPLTIDNVAEDPEFFSVTLSSPSHATLDSDKSLTHVIVTDDAAPTSRQVEAKPPAVTISADQTSVTEGGDVTFTVTAAPAPAQDLVVNVAVDEEMGDGGDALASTQIATITIPAGEASMTWTVTTMSDDVTRADGTAVGRIVAGDGYTLGTPSSATLALLDDGTPDGARIQGQTENPALPPDLVAQVRALAGQSHHGTAHVNRWRRVLMAFGVATYAGLTPTTAAEARANAQRYSSPLWPRIATVLAALEAGPVVPVRPVVTIVADAEQVDEGGDVTFTLTAAPAPARDLAVHMVADEEMGAGDDLVGSGHIDTVTIPAGESSATWTVTAMSDEVARADGTMTGRVVAGDGYAPGDPSEVTLVLLDDDKAALEVRVSGGDAVTEGGDALFTLTASPAPATPLAVSVTVAAEGDFGVPAGTQTVTIPASGSFELTLATANDKTDEADGAVTLTVVAGDGYTVGDPAAETVAVRDDDEPLPLVLSVADATVTEGEQASLLWFTVRLSEPSATTVTARADTRPSTPVSAKPREDYWPMRSGLVRFRPGETEWRVAVYIADDNHDEDAETFELVLSKARGAAIGDGVAVGTIVNSDPMPAAWLARFGRTVAQQALDGIAGRLAAPRTPGAQGTFAGQSFTLRPRGGDDPAPAAGTSLLAGLAAQVLPTLTNGAPGAGPPVGFDPGAPGGAGTGGPATRTLTLRDILLGSSFTATGQPDAHGGSVAFWGRAAQARFEGREGTFALDGETTTAMLGTDYARDRWLLGVTLLQSRGTGGYDDRDATPGAACAALPAAVTAAMPAGLCNGAVRQGAGAVESTLTAAVPYAAFQASERLKLWGAAGYGVGDVTLAPETGGTLKTDIAWTMAEVGLRGTVLAPPPAGTGPTLAVTSDALWARTTSEQVRHGLAASDSAVTRLRLGLEGQWPVVLETLGQLTPTLAVGARHDGGEAETGFGVELGGGLAWTAPQVGLALTLEGRTLLTHRDEDFRDQGVAAAFTFDPDPTTPRGPSVTLRQDWGGQATGGVDALFAADPLTQRQGPAATSSRWAAEAAWGFPAFGGRFTGSPHVGVGLAPGTRDYRLGWRLVPATPASALSLALQATRRELDAAPPEHTVGLELSTQW